MLHRDETKKQGGGKSREKSQRRKACLELHGKCPTHSQV